MPRILQAVFSSAVLILSLHSPARGQARLSEKELIHLYRSESLNRKASEARQEQAVYNSAIVNEIHQPQAYGSLNYGDSKEKSLTPFQPTLGPSLTAMAGIRQRYIYGLSASAEAFTQEVSTADGLIDRATRFGGLARVSMDLWRNYLGKLDQANLQATAASEARISLETKVQDIGGEFALRKLFWSIVAVDESVKVNQELTRSAERQLKEARSRARDGIADQGEVARYQAQLESRESTKLTLELQRQMLESALKRQIRSLQDGPIKLADVSFKDQEQKFQKCSSQILARDEVPAEFAVSSQFLQKLKAEFEINQERGALHSSPDLNLDLALHRSGVDQATERAARDFVNAGKFGYTIGLNFVVPLGTQSDFTQKKLLNSQRLAFEAQSEQLLSELKIVHSDTQKALRILAQALERQAKESYYLGLNLKETQKKFQQGRIPVSLLIQEQDGLFGSRLTEIEIKKQIVHATFDYFLVFSEFPCEMNQLEARG